MSDSAWTLLMNLKRAPASNATQSHSHGARFLNVTQTSVLNAGERFSRNSIDTASTLS